MRPFQKPYQIEPTEASENDTTESSVDAIFWGIIFWVVIIALPTWFIVDRDKRDAVKNIALTVIILDLMCHLLVARIVQNWPNRKTFVLEFFLCLILGAGVLWFTDHKIWALSIGLLVCTTGNVVFLKWLAERFLDRLSREDETED